jgi:peroxiredoxin
MQEEIQKARRLNYQSIILVFLFFAGVGVIVLLQTQKASFNSADKPRFKKGTTAPDFTLPDLDGKPVSLANFRGKVVFLNIWATWCAPCIEEMPSIEKLYQELHDEEFEILAVSIDEAGADVVLPFMRKHKLSFPALIDKAGTIKSLYRITGVPESFIIDRGGRVVEEVVGPRDWASTGVIRYFRGLIRSK